MSEMPEALPKSELERLIKIKGRPADPVIVEADAGERAALAKRFGLPGIDTLHAEVDVEQRGTAIRATGTLTAAIRQSCAISGEDFPAQIEEALDLRFVEKGTPDPALDEDAEVEIELHADDCDEIEYSGDAFDLGEAIAQTLGLAIDPYAEGPSADEARAKAGISKEGEQEGPLADMLRGLTKD
ncbi:DUF177 domain-containing protein [uncultured Erythrobacter sp.]|uniref:YceD family protein n=1 Tax=uncultured Erythrobacter sp. TaxID=263913 RepID=UPI00345CB815